jgi:hypothetical protein
VVQSVSTPQPENFDPERNGKAMRLLHSRASPRPEAWLGKKKYGAMLFLSP